jgi:hypothetical protein
MRVIPFTLMVALAAGVASSMECVCGQDIVANPPTAGTSNRGGAQPVAPTSLLRSRESLKSGVCRASWKYTINTSTKSSEDEGKWKFVFDYEKGLSRIDRELITTVRRGPERDRVFARRFRRVKRIETSVEVMSYVEGVQVISRQPPGSKAFLHAEPFDLRTIGLVSLISLDRQGATCQMWVDYIHHAGVPDVSEASDGNVRLVWDSGVREIKGYGTPFYQSSQVIVWINPAQQFSPVRCEFWDGTSQTQEKEIRRELREVIEAEWTEKEGTWVPTRCRWQRPKHRNDESELTKQAELTFEWESVNSHVSETLFTPEAVGAPPGTYVVRIVGEQSQIEYILGQPPPPDKILRRMK